MTRLLHTTFILTSFLFIAQVYAESDYGGLLDFSIDGSNANIIGFTAGTSTTTLTIPATVSYGPNTYSVPSIGDSAFRDSELTSVTIPDSLTSIGTLAFANNRLTSIVFGDSVDIINSSAFMNNQLNSITLPESVTLINRKAFSDNKLTSITIPSSVTQIYPQAFSGNRLTSVLFKADYSEYFYSESFYGNLKLSAIEACDNTSGWDDKSFANGGIFDDESRTIPVTLIDCLATLQ